MNAISKTNSSPFGAMTAGMKLVATLIVALTLAVTALLAGAVAATDDAYAAVYAVEKSAQADTDDADAAAADEVIADDENPMSSGLDDAMVATNSGVPLYVFAALGIVVVAALFTVGTRKLNLSISKMNQSVR